jgi:Uma2 family endonuclease
MPTLEKKPATHRKVPAPIPKKIPEALIYEIMDGEPIYYAGYREVLSGKKTIEDIMGRSTLQWVLVSYFMRVLVRSLDERTFWFASGEAGVHIDHRSNLSHDVAVYEKAVLTPDKINTKYADVPAKLAIEIDVKADLSNSRDQNYVHRKTRKLLDFGTEKVIWLFTETRQVMVAERGADAWLTMDWHRDLTLLDGVRFNIGQYLEDEGIRLDDEE